MEQNKQDGTPPLFYKMTVLWRCFFWIHRMIHVILMRWTKDLINAGIEIFFFYYSILLRNALLSKDGSANLRRWGGGGSNINGFVNRFINIVIFTPFWLVTMLSAPYISRVWMEANRSRFCHMDSPLGEYISLILQTLILHKRKHTHTVCFVSIGFLHWPEEKLDKSW